jgi:hypothetical protein
VKGGAQFLQPMPTLYSAKKIKRVSIVAEETKKGRLSVNNGVILLIWSF